MTNEEVIVRIGGAAGEGVQSAGSVVAKSFSRTGLNAMTYNYYQDIVRGGQSWYQVRASHNKVRNQGDGLDVLIALNIDALKRHTNPEINEGGASPLNGIAIFDTSLTGFQKHDNVQYCPVPLGEIAGKHSKVSLVKNTVAIGAAMASVGMPFDVVGGVIMDTFGGKGDVAEQNVSAAKEGYEYYNQHFKKLDKKLSFSNNKKYLLGGGEAIGLGAVNGGLKMYIGYPMTPASSALHYVSGHAKDFNLFVKIPEDEISAINMAIGANYAGLRAMTGSSGGGFSLMVEALGMAGMLEIPLVVYEAQRSGPSTGLPTKTEQGDLNLVLGASQGDFPRIVLAPRNVYDAFLLTREAMNLAEKYQTPVIVMSDLYLAEHLETVDKFDFSFKIEHGLRAQDNAANYKRYEYTANGISPRAVPGQPGLMHNEDSDEHSETGDVVSDAETDPKLRIAIMDKRMRKLDTYVKEMPPTDTYMLGDADYAIVQWGSTQGVVEEAVDILRSRGIKAGAVEVNRVFPLNPDIAKLLKNRKKIIVVESNFTGQFNRLLRSEFLVTTSLVKKYDGEAFYPGALAEELEQEIKR